MNLQEWVDAVVGKPVDVDGSYGAQCVDLVNDYLMRCWALGRVSGNAVDIAGQRLKGFTWETNGRLNHPPAGAIVVWGNPPYGHTAVALWSSPLHLISLDQNWGGVMLAQVWLHDYRGVVGWHHR